jgi:hypothetical protein
MHKVDVQANVIIVWLANINSCSVLSMFVQPSPIPPATTHLQPSQELEPVPRADEGVGHNGTPRAVVPHGNVSRPRTHVRSSMT